MRNIFAISLSILILSFSILAQSEKIPCPAIQITEPDSITTPGEIMTFSVKIESAESDANLKYNWTTSSGAIIEGQNTSTIKVATTPEMSGEKVTAKVIVQGVPENCADSISAWAIVSQETYDPAIDSFGKISLREEKGRLDNLFTVLANNPTGKALIKLSLTENENTKQAKNHIKQIIKHIIFRRQPKEKFVFVIEKSSFYQTTYQVLVENQDFSMCKDCEIIEGKDVK